MRAKSSMATNKPKKTKGGNKKFAVLVKDGDKDKIVRFGDPNMEHHSEGGKKGSWPW